MLPLGYKHTPETIKKIRQTSIGHIVSAETRRKIGKANSIALLGHIPLNKGKTGVYTPERLKQMRLDKLGKKGYWKGKKRSQYVLDKLLEAHTGKPSPKKGKK